jgi:Flp pilus assembly protein TadD
MWSSSTDTALAHLAGGLGVPVWLVLPYSADWRWLAEREDSPWYPTMRLFRQPRPGDWEAVFQRVAAELRQRLGLEPVAARPSAANREAERLHRRGLAQIAQGQFSDAVSSLRRALTLIPGRRDGHHNLGVALGQAGRPAEAALSFRQALRLRPQAADTCNNLGLAYLGQNLGAEAEAVFRQGLAVTPRSADLQNHLGVALERQGRTAEAASSYRQALRLRPDWADAHSNLGNALRLLGRVDESLERLREAVRLNPRSAIIQHNLGLTLLRVGKLDEAITAFERTLEQDPQHRDARMNLAVTLGDLDRVDEAITQLRELVRLHPDHPEGYKALALQLLTAGQCPEGWATYEWRWKCAKAGRRGRPSPAWDGSALAGRTILLRCEQGLGDTLQFVRFGYAVQQRGGRVILECQPPLVALLRTCPGIDQVVPGDKPLPPNDVQAGLLSLPGLLGVTLDNLPVRVPYVHVAADLRQRWYDELAAFSGFKVGIIWQGNPKYIGDKQRSIPLSAFAPLFDLEGVSLFSLQKGFAAEQIAALSPDIRLTDLGPRLDESGGAFLDTAAVLTCLDLLVTSDTAVAHLAGALGVPVWLALSDAPNWRWLRGREDCPWYPTMRLFRQSQRGDWQSVFERMAGELAARVAQGTACPSVPIEMAPGELIDKITILQIKAERITDGGKRANVQRELALLLARRSQALWNSAALCDLSVRLKQINESLWDVEDALRECERAQDFGSRFVELARSVYRQNDERAAVKRQINVLLGATLVEEKSYAQY